MPFIFLVLLFKGHFFIGVVVNVWSHLRFYAYEYGLVPTCTFRKHPILVQHNQSISIIFETNCRYETARVFWAMEDSATEKHFSARLRFEGNRRYLYEAFLPLQDKAGVYIYQVELLGSRLLRSELKRTHCLSSKGAQCTPIRVIVFSDNQFGARVFSSIARRAAMHKPQYLFHIGDAVQSVRPESWQTDFFDVLHNFQLDNRPLVHVQGNHDDEQAHLNKKDFYFAKEKPWSAFSLGETRIILLNSNINSDEQLEWLDQELTSKHTYMAKFRIVLVHIPPYIEYWDPKTWAEGESKWGWFVRDRWLPLMKKYRVDMIISGHQHNYERGEDDGVFLAVVGGAGGELETVQVKKWNVYQVVRNEYHYVLMDIYPQTIIWRAYNIDGVEIDTKEINSKQ